MRLAHAVIAGILLGGALGWWAMGHPGYETDAEQAARVQAAREAAEPHVYRWRDDNGVLQVTDQPPKGRKYERVELREDVNVIPMSEPTPAPPQ